MNRVVLDAELRAKLNGGTAGIEFTDEAGNVVGHYLPQSSFHRLIDLLFPPATKEEIAEARREMLEKGGLSTGQILEAIESARRARTAYRS
jgi:hypothetical protein